ncbi:MAG: UDP-N-acetylglucosamine 1-carboxyvinyltransferase [Planctomycetaceae bacterium]
MDRLVIQGGTALRGEVRVDGAKNAALPIMAACLAVSGDVRLHQVPDLVDVTTMTQLLQSLGATVSRSGGNSATINADAARLCVADYELVRRMRASICVLGPLLARFGQAKVSLPGGCNIGHRPIDLHLKGLAALGADLKIENGYVVARAKRLLGTNISLDGPFGSTVTGTCNVLVAAALAHGRSLIRSAAREPEVVDLGRFLISAGAEIQGLGTSEIEVVGVPGLHGVEHTIVPDRIEAATFLIAAAATRGQVFVPNANPDDLQSVMETLVQMGATVQTDAGTISLCCERPLRAVDIVATPFPGIPTDTQAQFMALLCTVNGHSVVRDNVFPDRLMHASELLRMGANLHRNGNATVLHGGTRLTGASVMASDLRASAALVIAGLAADSETTVHRIYHLDRGYAALETKLTALGANIMRVRESHDSPTLQPPHFHKQHQTLPDSFP